MSKELVKKASTAGIEQLLQTFMPTVLSRLDTLEKHLVDLRRDNDARFRSIEEKFDRTDEKFERMNERFSEEFEKTQNLINELGLRINTVGTRLEAYTEMGQQSATRMDSWLERLVKVEIKQASRRRAG